MTFVLGADATAGILEETRHKGEGRRVAKGDRDREVPRGSVPGSLGCGGRCGAPPNSCLREVAPRGEQIGPEETALGGSHSRLCSAEQDANPRQLGKETTKKGRGSVGAGGGSGPRTLRIMQKHPDQVTDLAPACAQPDSASSSVQWFGTPSPHRLQKPTREAPGEEEPLAGGGEGLEPACLG